MRSLMGFPDAYFYVCLQIYPKPTPQWFILNPLQRRLKPIPSNPRKALESSSFVVVDCGIYVIGGTKKGKPTCDVWFLDCFSHTWRQVPSMKMPRASPLACLIDGKIYVFGRWCSGCKVYEVFDPNTQTWESFFIVDTSGKKMIFDANIKHSAVRDGKGIHFVDEKDRTFIFLPDGSIRPSNIDSKPGCRNDWCFIGEELYCLGTQGRILWCHWCDSVKLDWKDMEGLEELQEYLIGWRNRWGLSKIKVTYHICKLCCNSAGNIIIFWNSLDKDAESLELWSAEISVERRKGNEIWGKIEWYGPVFKFDPLSNINVLCSASVYA